MLAPIPGDQGDFPDHNAYRLVAVARTSRVASDTTIENVVQVSAQSQLYGVTYTWFVDPKNWTAGTNAGVIGAKTAEVNQVCGHENVIGFRTVQDQDASRLLVNFAVITVGTDDGARQDDVVVRMDAINNSATFTAIDAKWQELVAAGAS